MQVMQGAGESIGEALILLFFVLGEVTVTVTATLSRAYSFFLRFGALRYELKLINAAQERNIPYFDSG